MRKSGWTQFRIVPVVIGVLASSLAAADSPAVVPAPVLLAPPGGAVLANGMPMGRGRMTWEFAWSPVPAASRYQLFVKGPTATVPMIDRQITNCTYRFESGGYVADRLRKGWHWKVRAQVGDTWSEWSELRTFDVKSFQSESPPPPAPRQPAGERPSDLDAALGNLRHVDATARLEAVERLAESDGRRDPRSLAHLIEALRDDDPRVRERVACVLAAFASRQAVEPLITALRDENGPVRATSARTLGNLGDARAVEPLLALLEKEKDPRNGVAFCAICALGDLKDKRAVGPLLAVLASPASPPQERQAAAEAVGKLRDSRAIPPLLAVLADPAGESNIRQAAVKGLGASGDTNAVPRLVALLADEDWQVAKEAVVALGALRDRRAVEPLCALLRNQAAERFVRSNAPEALGKIGDRRALPALLEGMKDSNHFVRCFSAMALASLGWEPASDAERARVAVSRGRWKEAADLGPAAVEPLVAALRTDDDAEEPLAAAEALRKMGWQPADDTERAMLLVAQRDITEAAKLGPAAIEPLLRAGSWPGAHRLLERTRQAVIDMGPDAVEPLIALVQSKRPGVGSMAAQMLGWMKDARAVEPLIAVLGDKSHPRNTVIHAMEALGQLGDRRAVEPLIGVLKDPSPLCRHRAASALAALRDPRAIEPVTALLQDKDRIVREIAMTALGSLGRRMTAADISARLADPRLEARVQAARSLARQRDPRALDPLLEALREKSPEMRREGAGGLLELADKRSVEALVLALKDDDTVVRNTAAGALAAIRDPRAVEPLIAALDEPNPWVREAVIVALGDLGDPRAIAPLRKELQRGNTDTRAAAGQMLARLKAEGGPDDAVNALLQSLEHPRDEWAGMAASLGVFEIGPPAVKPLEAALHNSSPGIRKHAAECLGFLRDKSGTPPLISALNDPDGGVARAAAAALPALDDARAAAPLAAALANRKSPLWQDDSEGAIPAKGDPIPFLTDGVPVTLLPLVSVMQDGPEELRGPVVWALGRQGDKQAVEPLAKALKALERSSGGGQERLYERLCGQALVRLGSPLGIAALVGMTQDLRSGTEPHDDLGSPEANNRMRQLILMERDATLEAVAALGPAAVEPLMALLRSTEPDARSVAARTLGRIGDRRALPALLAARPDSEQSVREAVAEAIRSISGRPESQPRQPVENVE